MMVDIIPVFRTAAGALGEVAEEAYVSLPFEAEERVTVAGVISQFLVVLGPAARRVSKIEIDGVITPFVYNETDGAVLWATPLTHAARITLTLRPAVTYTLLNGTLPPGLTLDASQGVIRGVVANILVTTDYRFTIRIDNGQHKRDRTFSLRGLPKNYPASFVLSSLGSLTTEREIDLRYKNLGTFDRGGVVAYTMDIIDRDGVLPPLVVTPITNLPQGTARWGGLPPGIVVLDTTIRGAIDPKACPGRYYFRIQVLDPIAPSSMVFMIEVTSKTVGSIDLIPRVVWDTDPDLGSVYETEPSHFQVAARSLSTTARLVYSISPASGPLPEGVAIDMNTGRFIGVFQHVDSDTVYSFTIRAQAGTVFTDRVFKLKVMNRYFSDNIYRMNLRLRAVEKKALFPAYVSLIPEALIYRSDDPSFGRKPTADAYMMKGLDGNGDLEKALRGDGEPPGRVTRDYHEPFRLILGTHRFGVARDSNGRVVYEVLLRELYDPASRAGGFAPSDIVSEQKIIYPQAPNMRVFPNSVNNIRRDLVDDLGFAVSDETRRRTIGINGPELMPLWMRSQQVLGDDSSIVGFYLGIVVAYLKPGSIATVSRLLLANRDLMPDQGKVYYFDKYYTTGRELETSTTFDDGELTFDTPLSRFDAVYSDYTDTIKYLD
jgi:hypothetical protein